MKQFNINFQIIALLSIIVIGCDKMDVSISEEMSGKIFLMKKIDGNKKIPIKCNKDNFLSRIELLQD